MSLKSRITTIIVFIICLPLWVSLSIGQKFLGSSTNTYSRFLDTDLVDLIRWW